MPIRLRSPQLLMISNPTNPRDCPDWLNIMCYRLLSSGSSSRLGSWTFDWRAPSRSRVVVVSFDHKVNPSHAFVRRLNKSMTHPLESIMPLVRNRALSSYHLSSTPFPRVNKPWHWRWCAFKPTIKRSLGKHVTQLYRILDAKVLRLFHPFLPIWIFV